MWTKTYYVAGMTCDHCVRVVKTEVGALAGVTAVAADLATGALTVTAVALDDAAVAAAIDEAGYALVVGVA